ncbi:MAG: M14 family zinc carboxypeptidase [Planctomycetota bacterium]|nr:M14 family zinc carboxypeptidase [Planctomycetota bacterium]
MTDYFLPPKSMEAQVGTASNSKGSAGTVEGRLNDENNTVLMDTAQARVISNELTGNFVLPLRAWKVKGKNGEVVHEYKPTFSFSNNFPMARGVPLFRMEQGKPVITVVSLPENLVSKGPSKPGSINDSPWYSVKIGVLDSAKKSQTVTIEITPALGEPHRYNPWICRNKGKDWQLIQNTEVLHYLDSKKGEVWSKTSLTQVGSRVRFDLTLSPGQQVHIAAQPPHSPRDIRNWVQRLCDKYDFAHQLYLPQSDETNQLAPMPGILVSKDKVLGRPTVVIVGGQHPPEVTGRIGLEHFSEAFFGPSAQGKKFRERFNVVIIPMLNERGMLDGHWRHNRGGIDSNRDWGTKQKGFNFPETNSTRELLLALKKEGATFVSFIDLHSTYGLKGYTPDVQGDQGEFIQTFMKEINKQLPELGNWKLVKLGTDKYETIGALWASRVLNAPSIVLEYGDDTSAAKLKSFSETAAKIFMTQLQSKAP